MRSDAWPESFLPEATGEDPLTWLLLLGQSPLFARDVVFTPLNLVLSEPPIEVFQTLPPDAQYGRIRRQESNRE